MTLNERPIPEPALRDPDAVEMLRVWIAEQGLHCSLKIGMYRETMNVPEEKAWGKILADVTRHIAHALQTGYAVNPEATMQQIRDSFLAELQDPDAEIRGGIVSRH